MVKVFLDVHLTDGKLLIEKKNLSALIVLDTVKNWVIIILVLLFLQSNLFH